MTKASDIEAMLTSDEMHAIAEALENATVRFGHETGDQATIRRNGAIKDARSAILAMLDEQAAREARIAVMRGLLEESWHFVKAIEEYEGERHTLRWEQSLDLRKRIDAALADQPAKPYTGDK